MKELMKDIKRKEWKPVYLLFGEERYLVRHYEKSIRENVVDPGMETMNMDIFEGKTPIEGIADAVATLPFMSEKRLVIVRNSGLFATTGRKDDAEKMAAILPDVPDTTVLLFVEESVDKRGKIYKRVSGAGRCVDCAAPSEKELLDWVSNIVKKSGKHIERAHAVTLLRTVAPNMDHIHSELEKLIAFRADAKEITGEDIEQVCTKSLETYIFRLVSAAGNKRPDVALDIFANMLLNKEQPIVVLTMLARQFRLLLHTQMLLAEGVRESDLAQLLSVRSFAVREYVKQCRDFSRETLLCALADCLDADIGIKTGRIGDRLAVEMLIVKYAAVA